MNKCHYFLSFPVTVAPMVSVDPMAGMVVVMAPVDPMVVVMVILMVLVALVTVDMVVPVVPVGASRPVEEINPSRKQIQRDRLYVPMEPFEPV